MYSFVVFDLDGTLLNTLPDIAGAMNRVLKRNGLPGHPEESYKIFTGNGAKMLTLRALGGRGDLLNKVYPEYLSEYAPHSREMTRPYEGVPQMLKALQARGIQLIVYSNKDDSDTKSVVSHYFADIPFARVVGSLPGVPLKPDPTALNRIMNELNLMPENGLYLGDTVMDMQCAKAARIYAVAALWGFQSEEVLQGEDPDRLIREPGEMLEIATERFSGE